LEQIAARSGVALPPRDEQGQLIPLAPPPFAPRSAAPAGKAVDVSMDAATGQQRATIAADDRSR